MAKIELGIGLAHAPQLHTAVEDWHIRAERDRTNGVPHVYRGRLLPWQELYEERKDEGYDKQISLEQQKEKLDASWETIGKLVEKYEEKKPDYAVIFGNDQHEIMLDGQIQPPFTIITAETVANMPRTEEQLNRVSQVPGIVMSDHGHLPPEHQIYPAAPELAHHLVAGVMADEFDVAISSKVPKADTELTWTDGMPHAFGFIYRNIMHDNVIPHVPIAINTFFGPNQPSAKRCLEFGKSIGRAIQAWDKDVTVGLMCSGGLSHFAIDEQLDREFLKALKEKDYTTLTGHEESWYQSGTSELKNWIALAGALSVVDDIDVSISDYHAFYRTEAGTGNGSGFVCWE